MTVATPSTPIARAQRPAVDLVVGGDVHRVVPSKRVPGDDDVDDEQDDRDRDGHLGERVGVGVAAPAGHGRDEEEQRRDRDAARTRRSSSKRSSGPRPPATSEAPRTSRRFPTTLPVSDPRTTSVRPSFTAMSAMISSGAFPKVALRKPPMPGPVCSAACSVASPISHASGMSESAARTNSRVSADERCSAARSWPARARATRREPCVPRLADPTDGLSQSSRAVATA